jgi:hypothetical protein
VTPEVEEKRDLHQPLSQSNNGGEDRIGMLSGRGVLRAGLEDRLLSMKGDSGSYSFSVDISALHTQYTVCDLIILAGSWEAG